MLNKEEIQKVRKLPLSEVIEVWDKLEKIGKKKNNIDGAVRFLCQNDLAYLLIRACRREDMLHPWIYARIREVEAEPYGCLDLWAREHYKSTIQTFGQNIQAVLKNPDITIGIFSHTRPIAKAFLRQIMREFQENVVLHNAFPDVLWGKNIKESPKWSEDDGIIVKRKANPNEATIEAWGLVDGQPTSKHFLVLDYDDIVVAASVTTPEMIKKTMNALEQSYNLGVTPHGQRKFIGTCWHFNDAYATLRERNTAKLRWHPGKEGGTKDGKSVYWPEEVHEEKRRSMGIYNYAAQILLNPQADSLQGFKLEWIQHYNVINPQKLNKYILVDAASSKKKGSDYTAMIVVGLGGDGNYYILDIVRDRLNLKERADALFRLHRSYKPKEVRYEKYGAMSDIEHMQDRMDKETYHFKIKEVGGQVSKEDRIKRLLPLFEAGRIFLPRTLNKINWDKKQEDLIKIFVDEEYLGFPVGQHDDMLDSLARICEPNMDLAWPKEESLYTPPPTPYFERETAWMV
jgi:predicted phage terminase large subunit-like protein